MSIAATALATTDNTFADKKRHDDKVDMKSQAVSQVNDCGNGFYPENVWCQNTASQIQGEDNRTAIASSQGPNEESNGPGMQQSDIESTDQQAYVEE